MRLDPNPLFRRVITPWYSSSLVCWIVFLATLAVMLFSWTGISLAFSRDAFHGLWFLPCLMLGLSLFVFIVNFFRMIRRYPDK